LEMRRVVTLPPVGTYNCMLTQVVSTAKCVLMKEEALDTMEKRTPPVLERKQVGMVRWSDQRWETILKVDDPELRWKVA